MNDSDANDERNKAGRRLLIIVGLLMFVISSWLAGEHDGWWLAPLGVGLVLTAWLGFRYLPLWGISHFLTVQFIADSSQPWTFHLSMSVLLTIQIGVSWLAYMSAVRGSNRLDDPHNATVFLIVIALVAAAFALADTLLSALWLDTAGSFWRLVGRSWMAGLLGVLVTAPALFVVLGPFLQRRRIIAEEPEDFEKFHAVEARWTIGEQLETAGLSLTACLLALAMTVDVERGRPNWRWWVVLLLVVVWSSLRLRLRGGLLTSGLCSLVVLVAASIDRRELVSTVFQGYLLAQCTTALLVGVSANWIRASEDRFRQLMGHLPIVFYSVRLTGLLPEHNNAAQTTSADRDHLTQSFWRLGRVTLVSSGANEILGCRPEDLLGSLEKWKFLVEPSDLEVVQAAFLQLTRADRPITYEYRVLSPNAGTESNETSQSADRMDGLPVWVRDTLVPHYREDGMIDGWDGVIQNITESRQLAQQLRRTSGMLHALVENLPTGVFFVQGPEGTPILVNARARHLLGRREDLAAGCGHLSDVFRLHRPDGREYPVEGLPVTKALRSGLTSMADDVVVHRSDGRKVPLITWAAPVDLGGLGKPDAAVWVLEDLTALHKSERSRRESEARLRAVIETMADGVVVFDSLRKIVEMNPAAKELFGDALQLGKTFSDAEAVFCWEDGSTADPEELPIAKVFESRQPVRNVVLGLRNIGGNRAQTANPSIRWLIVNAIPLPAIQSFSVDAEEARVVATFTDAPKPSVERRDS